MDEPTAEEITPATTPAQGPAAVPPAPAATDHAAHRATLKAVMWLGVLVGFAVGLAAGVLLVHHRDEGRDHRHDRFVHELERMHEEHLGHARDMAPPMMGPGTMARPDGHRSTPPAPVTGPGDAGTPQCLLPEGCSPPTTVG